VKTSVKDSVHYKVQVWIVFQSPSVNSKPGSVHALMGRVIEKRGGGWHPITGSVEAHEVKARDWLGAAQREAQEETGLDPKVGTWTDMKLKFEFEGRWGTASERVYLWDLGARKKEPEVTRDPSEHERLEWVPSPDVREKLGFDSQRDAWDAVVCYLQDRDAGAI
jgi:8-oxo-dGTP pyrophosphatase MutT (NUDIX family)